MGTRMTRLTVAAVALFVMSVPSGHGEARLEVTTQILKVDSIIITSVESPTSGWVTIHIDKGGEPGTMIGHTAVHPGTNRFLYVTVDVSRVKPRLIAVLRSDAGLAGVLEVPGPDLPVQRDGSPVTTAFILHGCRGGILCDL